MLLFKTTTVYHSSVLCSGRKAYAYSMIIRLYTYPEEKFEPPRRKELNLFFAFLRFYVDFFPAP